MEPLPIKITVNSRKFCGEEGCCFPKAKVVNLSCTFRVMGFWNDLKRLGKVHRRCRGCCWLGLLGRFERRFRRNWNRVWWRLAGLGSLWSRRKRRGESRLVFRLHLWICTCLFRVEIFPFIYSLFNGNFALV